MTTVLRLSDQYTVLHSGNFAQIKRIEVESGKHLSLQSHQFRAEYCFIVSSPGMAQIASQIFRVFAGNTIDNPIGLKYRASNNSDSCIVCVEVQTGNSFDEIKIVRYEYDFRCAQDFSIFDTRMIKQLIA